MGQNQGQENPGNQPNVILDQRQEKLGSDAGRHTDSDWELTRRWRDGARHQRQADNAESRDNGGHRSPGSKGKNTNNGAV